MLVQNSPRPTPRGQLKHVENFAGPERKPSSALETFKPKANEHAPNNLCWPVAQRKNIALLCG